MEREPSKKREGAGKTINDALIHLEAIKSQLYPTGSVGGEPDDLESIRHRLLARTITPEEAITEANQIMEGRQDYH